MRYLTRDYEKKLKNVDKKTKNSKDLKDERSRKLKNRLKDYKTFKERK